MRANQRKTSSDPIDDGPQFRAEPELVRLVPRPGAARSSAPPVRIYLGTENAQYRAERVFVYSIEAHRDPGRTYEIYLLKNLRGYRRRSWRTGFTNYRFAIPEYAGGSGRAIYNDVDQIYLADPAELFDLPLEGHGYRAISAEDTSVMLLDCERMATWWNVASASSKSKGELLAGPAAEPGLWGALDGHWNARDGEYVEGRSKVLHYTLLHTQPWRPTPEQYSYHPHPLSQVWQHLEDGADRERYQVFNARRPSKRFETIRALRVEATRHETASVAQPVATANEPTSATELRVILDGRGGDATSRAAGCLDLARTDAAWPASTFDRVVAERLLERAPADDVPWLLDEVFGHTDRSVHLTVRCDRTETRLADGSPAHECVRSAAWWREQVGRAARRRGTVAWQLDLLVGEGRAQRVVEAYRAEGEPATAPRVWVLLGAKAGDNRQLTALADALGWPYEPKQLEFNRLRHVPTLLVGGSIASLTERARALLRPPWPDIVLSAGKRSVPAALWVRRRSGDRARLVHVGRPWAPLAWFDLIVTTPQYQLPARDNILHNTMPLNRPDGAQLVRARNEPIVDVAWDELPRPRIALLVGGNSSTHVLTPECAAKLGRDASDLATGAGGSLLVSTSPRTPPEAIRALRKAITCPNHVHEWSTNGRANPYVSFLALADSFIVTGDSASMVAEACSTGKPVSIFPLRRASELAGLTRVARRAIDLIGTGGVTYRGTPKQQNALARLLDRLVDQGVFTPPRDLEAYHQALELRGVAFRGITPGEPLDARLCQDELASTVARVRGLLRADRPLVIGSARSI